MSDDWDRDKDFFIQWKNTNVCMDLICPACHYHNHYDGFFAYFVQCAKCKALYELQSLVPFKSIESLPQGCTALTNEYYPDDDDFAEDNDVTEHAHIEPADLCIQALKIGRKILICGNGGSAAMASHFAAELVVRFAQNRRALPCIALTADQAVLTAAGNDMGYRYIFSRQVEALGQPGDVLIALSTSGKSENVLAAIAQASVGGLSVIEAPRRDTGTVSMCQEHQLRWIHDLARVIEEAFV